MTSEQDYYQILGVGEDASQDEIAKAYKKKARELHPDRNPDAPEAEEAFKTLGEAYETLKDPDQRARYDMMRRGGFDLGSLFGAFAGGFGGFGGFRGSTRVRRHGADIDAEVTLRLEELLHGARREFVRPPPAGQRPPHPPRETVEIDIPRGVLEGDVIRFTGYGQPGFGGGRPGDLFLRVRLAPHPTFSVDGPHLGMHVPVTPWEAALGATVEVPTLEGSATLRIPGGVQGGQRLRLKGQGLPTRDGERGDLYATIQIAIPKELTKKERDLFEKLAKVSKLDPRG